ncbi:hypothetical protein [Stenoxybacter acetivorans]|uniref:hypothetical protein n=1 Tax=Stenoxybacter acetivorans TaxID=422441 RepID=UPI000564916E|nr:hypothetical protein [Stenoxybacter acetivorans]
MRLGDKYQIWDSAEDAPREIIENFVARIVDFSEKCDFLEKNFDNCCCFYDFYDELKIISTRNSIIFSERENAIFWDMKDDIVYAS